MIKNAYLTKITILLQFGGKILVLLYSNDSIDILLIILKGFPQKGCISLFGEILNFLQDLDKIIFTYTYVLVLT